MPLGRDADLFIAEAYFLRPEVRNHLSLKTLEARLEEFRPRRLMLSHTSDGMLSLLDALAHAAGRDGMSIEI